MLISKSMDKIIRVLLQSDRLTLREIGRICDISLGIVSKNVNSLEATRLLKKRGGILADKPKLMRAYSMVRTIKELPGIEFTAAERPEYLIKKIAMIGNKNKLTYAFTLFSGTEIIAPYVSPDKTHLYILEKEKEKWNKILPENRIYPAQKGNVVLFLADREYFIKPHKAKEISVVSPYILYADLISYGGRGEEAAQHMWR